MSHAQGFGRQSCSLLAVFCGQFADKQAKNRPSYPFPELVSSGRLEVQSLVNPSKEKFSEVQKSVQPNIVYFQGQQLENEEQIGSLVWGADGVSDPETLSSLISLPLPTIVYVEVPHGENIAKTFHAKGVPYVIYWQNEFTSYAASHFRQALLSVVQSSCSHTWDAFQLAHASFRLYCVQNSQVSLDAKQKYSTKLGPHLLGDVPKINIPQSEQEMGEEDEEGSSDNLPSVKIYDEEIDMKFLVCGLPCKLDSSLLNSLADGLNALLNIEIRGSKLQNRVSAAPPPLQAGNFSRGVVTMRCDISTCSSAHISLLVSGSAQTCFDDQLLESHIKSEVIEKSPLIHALPNDEIKPSSIDPRNSVSIACGATVYEVCMRVPTWAAQVLKHLAPEISYRSLVTLGIASIQGTPVASFDKEDADRLLFFCNKGESTKIDISFSCPPRLFAPLTKEGSLLSPESGSVTPGKLTEENGVSSKTVNQNTKVEKGMVGVPIVTSSSKQKFKVSVMLPIHHSRKHKMLPFMGGPLANANDRTHVLTNLPADPSVKQHLAPPAATAHRKSTSSSLKAQQIIPVNPLPMKKHGCDRAPIQVCSEEEFLKDVMQFLILRGHNRLVPQGGISEFPDAILNAKRLDLYNLYREVVSRGGFYVGNGINWKGQVFSKMRNHTATNRMTGVGNTLKRHYETYLLEYELAHDDVDGECCLLCHSSAPGDWVNCGLCGEWAHFGCDRRQGLGTFKDYAKTDGLEYICPHCSITNCKKKQQKLGNGFSNTSTTISRHL